MNQKTEDRISDAVSAFMMGVLALGIMVLAGIGIVAAWLTLIQPVAVAVTVLGIPLGLAFWWPTYLYARDAVRGW